MRVGGIKELSLVGEKHKVSIIVSEKRKRVSLKAQTSDIEVLKR